MSDAEIPAGSSHAGASEQPAHAGIAGRAGLGLATPALERAPVAVYALDGRGRILFWNHAAELLFGWPAGDVVGRRPPFVPPTGEEEATRRFAEITEGTPFLQVEGKARRRDGQDLDVRYSVATLHDGGDVILVIARDVTAERTAQRRLADAESRWRALATRAYGTIALVDAEGRVQSVTDEPQPTLEHGRAAWLGRDSFSVVHPDDLAIATERWATLCEGPTGTRISGTYRARHADGHYVTIEFRAVNLIDDPAVGSIVVAYRPASRARRTERLAADEARVLEAIARDTPLHHVLPLIAALAEAHAGSPSGVALLTDEVPSATGSVPGPVIDALGRLTATPPDGAGASLSPARTPLVVTDVERDPRTVAYASRFVEAGVRALWALPIHDVAADRPLGFVVSVHASPRAPDDQDRDALEAAARLTGIALDRDRWQRELERQARYDALTDLPNRALVKEIIDDALEHARAERASLALAVIDIDRFKVVNDTLGHVVGDRLLREFAGRLRGVAGPRAVVGHLGADEFVVILRGGADRHDAEAVANRLTLSLQAPFVIDGEDVHLTASIGIATSVDGDEDADRLLQEADLALSTAKRRGRDRVQVFDTQLRTSSAERLAIDRDLRLAVERNELLLQYQPEVDIRTRQIVGVEALVRWNHPDRGVVAPSTFIEVAEETGTIVAIGYWVIEEAVRQAAAWRAVLGGLDRFSVSLNLSTRQLRNKGLADTVAFALTRYDWPPSQLTLELTESILIEDRDATMESLQHLGMLGVKLAIDDFGTGFASLDYLHRLRVDVVKLDRSFVEPIRADGSGSPVAEAMVGMAKAFGLTTTAEGVESEEQLEGLRLLGYDVAQGFLFDRALDADVLGRRLAAQRPAAAPRGDDRR